MEAVRNRRQDCTSAQAEATRLWAFLVSTRTASLRRWAQEPGAQGKEIDHVPHRFRRGGTSGQWGPAP